MAALTLDAVHRHADRAAMANLAQLVTCIYSLFPADGDRFVKTPSSDVSLMYAAHQRGAGVRVVVSAPSAHRDEHQLPRAARDGARRPLRVHPRGRGHDPRGTGVHDLNTLGNSRAVLGGHESLPVRDRILTHTFPAASVARPASTPGS